jgi:hypothetical protein
MITPSFNLTATERVLPKLALDFTTASLDPRITFTRTGAAATTVNASGFVESVAADTPRFDYNPITLICKGLLIEESRQNLFPSSGVLSDATYWSQINSTCTPQAVTNPANGASSDKVISNNGSLGYVAHTVSQTSGLSYTLSVFAKKSEYNFLQLRVLSSVPSITRTYFNLDTGVVASSSSTATPLIEPFGNGWYRCSMTYTTTVTTTASQRIYGQLSTTDADVGDGTSGIYIWGAQLEVGAFPTSYIPTTTTTVTRNADVATMTGTNFSDWYNQTQGSLYAKWTCFGTVNAAVASFTDNASSLGAVQIYLQARAASNEIRIWQSTTGGGLDNSATVQSGAKQGSAVFGYIDNTSVSGAANANAVLTIVATPQALVANAMTIGYGPGGAQQLNGYVEKLMYYPQRLINAELQAFSK